MRTLKTHLNLIAYQLCCTISGYVLSLSLSS